MAVTENKVALTIIALTPILMHGRRVFEFRIFLLTSCAVGLPAPGAFYCLGVELNVICKLAFLSSMSSPRSTLIVLIFALLIPSYGDRIAEATLSYELHERRHFLVSFKTGCCRNPFSLKSKAPSRRCQNSPFGLKQLTSLIFHFAKICLQKTF